MNWTPKKKLAQKRSRAGRWCWARERERERVGLLLLQLFPNGGATDIVFVTLFCIVIIITTTASQVPELLCQSTD